MKRSSTLLAISYFLLQVFGQTPFYTVENSQWSLWPEIPFDMVRFLNVRGFGMGGEGAKFEVWGEKWRGKRERRPRGDSGRKYKASE